MSGIQFSSPVTNQKASPAVYASSLATRPAPQLPGRIFVDTDNPSTGMYRDTGTVWVQLSSGAASVPDLQSVCNVGFLTDTDMTFLYTNSADTSKIGFLNQAVGDFTFDIFKKANELFSIRALKPSTVDEEMELIFDAPNNTIKTSFNSQDQGFKFDFVNLGFSFGINYGADGSLTIDANNQESYLYNRLLLLGSPNNGTFLEIDDFNSLIKTSYGGNNIGLKLDFALSKFYLGDFQGLLGECYFLADNDNAFALIISNGYTNFQGDGPFTQIGDCAATQNSTTFGVNDSNQTLSGSGNLRSATAGGNSGQHLKIRLGGTDYKIQLLNP